MKYIILFVLLKFVFVTSLTCDFHLVELNPDVLQHLPPECQEIDPSGDLYQQMIIESLLFTKYQNDLNHYEKDKDESYIETSEEETIPNKDWELRAKIYDEILLYECDNDSESNKTLAEITQCLIEKRQIMIDDGFPELKIIT